MENASISPAKKGEVPNVNPLRLMFIQMKLWNSISTSTEIPIGRERRVDPPPPRITIPSPSMEGELCDLHWPLMEHSKADRHGASWN